MGTFFEVGTGNSAGVLTPHRRVASSQRQVADPLLATRDLSNAGGRIPSTEGRAWDRAGKRAHRVCRVWTWRGTRGILFRTCLNPEVLMLRHRDGRWGLVLGIFIIGALGAHAQEVQYVKTRITLQAGSQVRHQQVVQVYLSGLNMRITAECPNPSEIECPDSLYLGDEKALYIINHPRKLVMKVTKADMERLSQWILPLLQSGADGSGRGSRRPSGKSTPPDEGWVLRKLRTHVRVGPYTCDEFELRRRGEPRGTACIASYENLGLNEAAFMAVVQDLARMTESVVRVFQTEWGEDLDEIPSPWTAILQGKAPPYSGLPVRQVVRLSTGEESVSELLAAGRQKLPPTTFQVPADYKVVSVLEALGQFLPGGPSKP
jgi:hypothetical protein